MGRKEPSIVTQQQADALTIGKRFAQEVRHEPEVQQLWLHESPERVELWLIAGAIDDEAELRLYRKSAILYDEFPGRRFRLHVIHPAMFADGTDLNAIVARDATRVSLQP